VRESRVEQALRHACEKRGVYIRKFTSPGHVGVPDRIILINGRTIFVETKSPIGDLDPWQIREHHRIRQAGGVVLVIYTLDDVENFAETHLDEI
jgi:hypothetical protein